MEILRQTIRELILESETRLKPFPFYNRVSQHVPSQEEIEVIREKYRSGEWTKDQALVWGILNTNPDIIKRFNGKRGLGDWSGFGPSTASGDEQMTPFDEEFADITQKHMQWAQFLRVSLRRLWEDRVLNSVERNTWFNPATIENQNIRCFHHPQLFRQGRPPQEGIDKFENYIQQRLSGSMPDLSVEGLLLPPPECLIRGSLSLEMKKRKIVWAGLKDQWTEFLSRASAKILNKNPTGIRKHPSTWIKPKDVLFDPAQIAEDETTITELIITDWDLHPDHIIIYYSYWLPKKPNDMKQQIENLGTKYFGIPYKVIERE